jgi:hypothetical protein
MNCISGCHSCRTKLTEVELYYSNCGLRPYLDVKPLLQSNLFYRAIKYSLNIRVVGLSSNNRLLLELQ